MRGKRIFSLLLVLALVVGLLPQTAMAATIGTEGGIPLEIEFLGVDSDHSGPKAPTSVPEEGLSEGDIIWLGLTVENMTAAKWDHLNKYCILAMKISFNYDADYIVPYTEFNYSTGKTPGRFDNELKTFVSSVSKYTLTDDENDVTKWMGSGAYSIGETTSAGSGINQDPQYDRAGSEATTLTDGANIKMLGLNISIDSTISVAYQRYYQATDASKQYLAIFPMKVIKTDNTGRKVIEPAFGGQTFTINVGGKEFGGLSVDADATAWETESGRGGYTGSKNLRNVFEYKGAPALFPGIPQKTDISGTLTVDKSTPAYGEEVTATWSGTPTDVNWSWNGAASAKTTEKYTPAKNDVGKTVYATVTPKDTTNYKGEVTGAAITVGKATLTVPTTGITLPAGKAGAEVSTTAAIEGVGGEKITVKYTGRYANDAAAESTPTVNVNISFNTAADSNYYTLSANTATATGKVQGKDKLTGEVKYDPATAVYGTPVTAKLENGNDGTNITWAWTGNATTKNTASYTPVKADVNNTISATATATGSSEYTGSVTGSNLKVGRKVLTSLPTAAQLAAADFPTVQVGATGDGLKATGSITVNGTDCGVLTGDTVTLNYTATYKSSNKGAAKADVEFTSIAGTDGDYYVLPANKTVTGVDGEVVDNPITGIAVAGTYKDTYTALTDNIDFTGMVVTATYKEGDPKTFNDGALPAGFSFKVGDTTVANGDKALVAMAGQLTVTDGNGIEANGVTITVNPAATTTEITSGNSLREGSEVIVSVTPKDGTDAEIKDRITFVLVNEDGTEGDAVDPKTLAVSETPYKIKAKYTAGPNTLGSESAVQELTITAKPSSHGGGGSSMLTVRFDAGVNGKITKGSSTVKVAKNEKLKSSDIPTVTANEGYRFLGWTLDGSKTVDPTDATVTSSVTYRALYNTGAAHGVYMRGDSDGNFYPDRNISRAEAAALIARLNANYSEGTKYSSSLTDVAAEEWYASAVNFCASSGLITGYDDGTFLPNNQITRQEFCAIVARYLSLNNAGEANFSDVNEDIWGAGYISQLAGKGIINGYEDGTFAPNAPIKRCEVVKILNGVFDRTPDASTVNDNIGNYSVRIPDVSANHWAYYEILEAAVEHDHADFHKAN